MSAASYGVSNLMLFNREDVEKYLAQRHSTLWGRPFDIIRHKDEAADFIMDMLERIEQIHMESAVVRISERIMEIEEQEGIRIKSNSEIQSSLLGKSQDLVRFTQDKGNVFTHSLWSVRKSFGRRKRDRNLPNN